MTNGHLPPLPGGNIIDLGQLVAQKAANDQLAKAKVVIFPLSQCIEWMLMDGSYTVVSEGLPKDARNIGQQPTLIKDGNGQPCVVMLFTHPDWEEHDGKSLPILPVTWKRIDVAELGDEKKKEAE